MRMIDADELQTVLYAIADEFKTEHIFIDAIVDAIGNAPTIEVPTWIPVAERLPKRLGNRVLVTDGSTVALGHYEQPHWINLETDDFFSAWGWEITHWMPLPDAPKDGDT